MSRETYESDADRANEKAVLAQYCDACGERVLAHKLSAAYGLDYALSEDRNVFAFLEVKVRRLAFGYSDGYYISALKVMSAKRLSAAFGIPCELVVQFSDGKSRLANFRDVEGLIMAGRRDRNDPFDIEPHCVLTWDCFTEVE